MPGFGSASEAHSKLCPGCCREVSVPLHMDLFQDCWSGVAGFPQSE